MGSCFCDSIYLKGNVSSVAECVYTVLAQTHIPHHLHTFHTAPHIAHYFSAFAPNTEKTQSLSRPNIAGPHIYLTSCLGKRRRHNIRDKFSALCAALKIAGIPQTAKLPNCVCVLCPTPKMVDTEKGAALASAIIYEIS